MELRSNETTPSFSLPILHLFWHQTKHEGDYFGGTEFETLCPIFLCLQYDHFIGCESETQVGWMNRDKNSCGMVKKYQTKNRYNIKIQYTAH